MCGWPPPPPRASATRTALSIRRITPPVHLLWVGGVSNARSSGKDPRVCVACLRRWGWRRQSHKTLDAQQTGMLLYSIHVKGAPLSVPGGPPALGSAITPQTTFRSCRPLHQLCHMLRRLLDPIVTRRRLIIACSRIYRRQSCGAVFAPDALRSRQPPFCLYLFASGAVS